MKLVVICRYYVRIFAANAKGKSNVVNLKVSTVKETSRLPLLPPEQSKRESVVCVVQPPPLILRYSGFYDGQDTLRYEGGHTKSPTRLEQTIFIILASLAGLAFLVVISLLLCKFQCQVLPVWDFIKTLNCCKFLVWPDGHQTIIIEIPSWFYLIKQNFIPGHVPLSEIK